MGQAISKMVGEPGRENLCLVFQSSERAGVYHAVAVSLKFISIGMRKLGVTASAGSLDWKFEMGQVPGHLVV